MMFYTVSILVVLIQCCCGSHFRGGTMSWRPVGDGKIELQYRLIFRESYRLVVPDFPGCTENQYDAVNMKTVQNLGPPPDLECSECIDKEQLRDLKYICTDYYPGSSYGKDDWFQGQYKLNYTIPSNHRSPLHIKYKGCCWIDVVSPSNPGDDSGWNMETSIKLQMRNDSVGKTRINSSPVTNVIPLENYHRACSYNLQVAVHDPDNDFLTCRYMRSDECHPDVNKRIACGGETRGLSVNRDCTLNFDATEAGDGAHAVNIVINDCPDEQCNEAYSTIPLLFLLNVTGEGDMCDKPMIRIPPSCKVIPKTVGRLFQMTVEAIPGSKPIASFEATQKPLGMGVAPGGTNYTMTLEWQPTADQILQERHSVCVRALDSDKFTSGQYCTFILVSQKPSLTASSIFSMPRLGGKVIANMDAEWTIQFNREIIRPKQVAYITLFNSDANEIINQVDVTKELVGYDGHTLTFQPFANASQIPESTKDNVNVNMMIQLDEGVAMPADRDGCGSEKDEWEFTLRVGNEAIRPPDEGFYKCSAVTVDVPANILDGEKCFLREKDTEVLICCQTSCNSDNFEYRTDV